MASFFRTLVGVGVSEGERARVNAQLTAELTTEIARFDNRITVLERELEETKQEGRKYVKKKKAVPSNVVQAAKTASSLIADLTKKRNACQNQLTQLTKVETHISTTDTIRKTAAHTHRLAKAHIQADTSKIEENFNETNDILADTDDLFDAMDDSSRVDADEISDMFNVESEEESEEEVVAAPVRKPATPVRTPVASRRAAPSYL
jgi:chromosome segregation ATPase